VTALRRTRVALFLAVRSLARGNAGVTLMSVAMMAAIFVSVMFLPSLIAGATDGLNTQVVGTLTGDLSITSSGGAFHDGTAYLAQIRAVDGVGAATGIRRIGAQVSHASEQVAVGIDAVDPASYAQVFSTPGHLIEGEWLQPGDTDGIVLGIGVAGADKTRERTYESSLRTVHTGDTVQVTLAGGQSHPFVVRGVYQNNFPLSDQGAFVTLAAADSRVPTTDVAEQLRAAFDGLDELTSSLRTASQKAVTLADGARAVSSAVGSLASGARRLASKTSSVDAGTARLASSSAKVAAGSAALGDAGRRLADGLEQVAALAQPAVASGADSATTDSANATALLVEAVTTAAGSAATLADDLQALAAGTQSLSGASARLAKATTGVAEGAAQIASAADVVQARAGDVAAGADALATALAEGAKVAGPSPADRDAILANIDALGTPPGKDSLTRIVVTTAPGASAAEVQQGLAALRTGTRVQGPAQLAAAIQDQLDTFGLIDRIMRVLSLLVAAITVIIITYIDLANRRRQIGIERAIGIRSASIVGSYVIRAVFTALVGTLAGYLLFRFVLVPVVNSHPFQFPTGPVTLMIVTEVTRSNVITLILVAAVAALIPAVRTVRMRILDAIWG
jgi:ABC-type lipoprotein release transport system permease subunit